MCGVATIPFVIWYSKQRREWARRSFRNKKGTMFRRKSCGVDLLNGLTLRTSPASDLRPF